MVVEDLLKVEEEHYQSLEELEEKKMEEFFDALDEYGSKAYIDFTHHHIWGEIVDKVEKSEMSENEVQELKREMGEAAEDCTKIYKEIIRGEETFWIEKTYGPMEDTVRGYDLNPPRGSVKMDENSFMEFSNYVPKEMKRARHEYNKVKERREEMEKYISDMLKDEKEREQREIRKEKFEDIWGD